MPGQKKSLLRRKFVGAPLSVTALAALVAGSLTLMIWQSPRNIVADVKPLIMDFGRSKVQSSSDLMAEPVQSSAEDEVASEVGSSERESSGPQSRPGEPVRTQRSNGGLVLEWPSRKSTPTDSEASDAKTQAKKILAEAEDYLLVGDLRRALTSARLAYSYPVKWDADEQSPEELLARLEALAKDPTFVASARREAIDRINSANIANTALPGREDGIGVWKPAPVEKVNIPLSNPVDGQLISEASESAIDDERDAGNIETVSASEIAEPSLQSFPAMQPYQSQPSISADEEPRRLDIGTHRQVSESTAEFATPAPINQIEPRPLVITDQRSPAPAASPIGALTFDVLATLTTIFAVLFFGALFVLLAILAIGKKLIGEKGVAFRIELVNNSPLTIQTAGGVPAPAPAEAAAPATNELKIDPDFEGILSLSEQRARQREAAILEQFIENNVSLHSEIGAVRAAA